MRIGVIQASSQKEKNAFIYESVKEYAKGHEVCLSGEEKLDEGLLGKVFCKRDAIDFILKEGKNSVVIEWIKNRMV